jgi:hypothetical protein
MRKKVHILKRTELSGMDLETSAAGCGRPRHVMKNSI